MQPLKGKKILYIGVSTFNYEKEIKAGLERLGASVDYFDERPANDFWTKVFLRLKLKKIIQSKVDSHYAKIMIKSKDIHYDYVFIIKLETIDKRILERLQNNQKGASFILYLWDSIQNYKGKELLLPYFDKAFSFDNSDTKKYSALHFLPLFYIPSYMSNSSTRKIQYDLCFIGTGHSDRYQLVKKIEEIAKENKLSIFSFFYLQSKLIYWFRKFFDKKLRLSHISHFSFSSLNQKQVIDIIKKSKVIIDIEHQGQVGLTMRTIEILGCKKKLLTTNKCIKEYDFYNKKNIYILDRNRPSFDMEFFNTPYEELDQSIYDKYSLENWLKTIFSVSHEIN